MKLTHIVLMASAISFASCNSNEPTNAEEHDQSEQMEGHEGHNHDDHAGHDHGEESHVDEGASATWLGSYRTNASCADCDGIRKEIALGDGMTFMQVTKHKGDHKGDMTESGRFSWVDEEAQILIINADTDSEMRYDVEGNQLVGLNSNGERLEGEGNELYTLSK